MAVSEIALVARAKGLATHLLARGALETLAEADDLGAFARGLWRGSVRRSSRSASRSTCSPSNAPLDEPRTGICGTLYRWQERTPGVLDVFAAHQDRRSLRALLRGAAEGAPSEARLERAAAHAVAATARAGPSSRIRHRQQTSSGSLVLLAHP